MQRIKPGPGQESVWDYPRPPRLAPSSRRVRIVVQASTIVDCVNAYRVLETSHPPSWYVPRSAVRESCLFPADGSSFCEFKGRAVYWDLRIGKFESRRAAWSYPDPTPAFAEIRDYLAFYPSRVDSCLIDDEQVKSQEGDFYGGWITSDVVGPFKGGTGSWGW